MRSGSSRGPQLGQSDFVGATSKAVSTDDLQDARLVALEHLVDAVGGYSTPASSTRANLLMHTRRNSP
jgi:hypothetical protein